MNSRGRRRLAGWLGLVCALCAWQVWVAGGHWSGIAGAVLLFTLWLAAVWVAWLLSPDRRRWARVQRVMDDWERGAGLWRR